MGLYDTLNDNNGKELKLGQKLKLYADGRLVTGILVDIRIIGKTWKRARGVVFLDEPFPKQIGYHYSINGPVYEYEAVREVRINSWTHPEVIVEDLTTSENTVSL